MFSFNWSSVDESTFQGYLNKYTNAFKGYQNRYFVLDNQAKSLLYFMPEEVRRKGPRGVIELTDCWISPSNEDDVTFSLSTPSGEIFRFRASDAKERQKWTDKLRTSSGSNAADLFVSSLPTAKSTGTNVSSTIVTTSDSNQIKTSDRRNSKLVIHHHQQTLKDMKEVLRCLALNQKDFVETIESLPDDIPLNSLSKEMLLIRSVSQSCIHSLHDSLMILTRRRTPDSDLHLPAIPSVPSTPSPQPPPNANVIKNLNLSGKQLSQSLNSGTTGKMNSTMTKSVTGNSDASLSKTASFGGLNQSSIFDDRDLIINKLETDIDLLNHPSESS